MKKFLKLSVFTVLLGLFFTSTVSAGDCIVRDKVNKEATIKTAVNVRSDCPNGAVVGTVRAGEKVRILEVDRYNEFYLVETSVGTGFLFSSFLINIQDVAPLKPAQYFMDSVFWDLSPNHKYYQEVRYVKENGIVAGYPDGSIKAEQPVNRAELAKILAEVVASDEEVLAAKLPVGTYVDIEEGEWYVPYLQLARMYGFMTGDSNGRTVRPGDIANGAEVARMISVAFGLDIETSGNFNNWYDPYFDALRKVISIPYQNPAHVVTRGEMMYMAAQVHKKMTDNIKETPTEDDDIELSENETEVEEEDLDEEEGVEDESKEDKENEEDEE